MYIRGAELLTNNLNSESLILVDLESDTNLAHTTQTTEKVSKDSDDTSIKVHIPLMLTLYSFASPKNFVDFSTAEKFIYIGCMRANTKKDVKKNGDFTFENTKEINLKGFNIDLQKVRISCLTLKK
jgi:hypothetical protein